MPDNGNASGHHAMDATALHQAMTDHLLEAARCWASADPNRLVKAAADKASGQVARSEIMLSFLSAAESAVHEVTGL